jgi:hypothetical protein
MPKYLVSATKIYELQVEADDWSEAYDKAFETPLGQWSDEHELHVEVEEIQTGKWQEVKGEK